MATYEARVKDMARKCEEMKRKCELVENDGMQRRTKRSRATACLLRDNGREKQRARAGHLNQSTEEVGPKCDRPTDRTTTHWGYVCRTLRTRYSTSTRRGSPF